MTLILITLGCEPVPQQKQDPESIFEESIILATPYSVWVSATKLTAFQLGIELQHNENFADKLCGKDINRRLDYDQHIALISTHVLDRADVVKKYNLNTTYPVELGDTGIMLSPHLGEFARQTGQANPYVIESQEFIKLTLSSKGKFSGYCTSKDDYTQVVNVNDKHGEMREFTTRCDQFGGIVCMSIKNNFAAESVRPLPLKH